MPDYTSLTFPAAPLGRPFVYINMVTSLDGRAIVDGSEDGLGSPEDRRLMRELRVHADVILVGAGTLRATGASPRLGTSSLVDLRRDMGKPPLPISAVYSRAGDLPLDRAFFTATDFTALVYLGDACPTERRRAIEKTGRSVVPVPAGDPVTAILAHMHGQLGVKMVLLEGGPTLNALFFERDAVDEVFLTLGPVIVGGDGSPIVGGGLRRRIRRLQLVSWAAHPATGELFLRYRRSR